MTSSASAPSQTRGRKAADPPHPTDLRLGSAVAARRRRLGLSQHDLALELAITYQQLQKYESGKNRISASRLWDLSVALKCDVSDFFGSTAHAQLGDGPAVPALGAFLKAAYGRETAARFAALPRELQVQMVGLLAPLARALAGGST